MERRTDRNQSERLESLHNTIAHTVQVNVVVLVTPAPPFTYTELQCANNVATPLMLSMAGMYSGGLPGGNRGPIPPSPYTPNCLDSSVASSFLEEKSSDYAWLIAYTVINVA